MKSIQGKTMLTRKSYYIIFLSLLLLMYACAHGPQRKETPEDLFLKAQRLAHNNKIEEAVNTFMKIRTFYPAHKLARESLVSIADLYYDHEDYESALDSYKEYIMLYPVDPKAPYCLYRMGMCHFKQMSTYDRDQSETEKAIQVFKDFLARYPKSPYASEVDIRLAQARKRLARHYIYIGKFYIMHKKYDAACRRLRFVKKNFSGLGLDNELSKLMSKACKEQ
ncbi:MAG: outer membrane protein assembly factor BamD [Deltaproteobacteria bacterium]|nr:outer membrane protein assembly factor BamD [Deltaproteobacteria bacterium]